ncbi:hypothetical protein [Pseudooceanicola sp. 200-1SW]|uniref:hypothetical protein n=1 Tax=Pseudooceanicola sp. 200-1SW TaxID=3425949 RepID=UPI003D7FDCAB
MIKDFLGDVAIERRVRKETTEIPGSFRLHVEADAQGSPIGTIFFSAEFGQALRIHSELAGPGKLLLSAKMSTRSFRCEVLGDSDQLIDLGSNLWEVGCLNIEETAP